MWRLQGWQLAFVASVMGAGAILLGYTELRRLLYAALDDRYGQWARFWARTGELPELGRRLGCRLSYAVAFFFCYGVHDLVRLVTQLLFDLFVVFALLSPFWRYVFFDDWNPALAGGMALAAVSVFVVWKVRQGMELCRVHDWSEKTRRCQRCGEYQAQAEEQEPAGKTSKLTAPPASRSLWDRLSWHGFWERRLERWNQRLGG